VGRLFVRYVRRIAYYFIYVCIFINRRLYGGDAMGRGDATKTDKLFLSYPSGWTSELEKVREEIGGLALQDAVRHIVAKYLEARKEDSA
jgi:hypothetical protein